MRTSFNEMMEIVNSLQEKLSHFLDIAFNLSFQESQTELTKCREFTNKIEKQLKDMVLIKTNSNDYCADFAADLMCQHLALLYEKAVSMTYTFRLEKELFRATNKKKKHVNKFTESTEL